MHPCACPVLDRYASDTVFEPAPAPWRGWLCGLRIRPETSAIEALPCFHARGDVS